MEENSTFSVVSRTSSSDVSLHSEESSPVQSNQSFGSPMMLPSNSGPMAASDNEKESVEYVKKRARNNLAVKKSRDRSKIRIMETQERVEQLTKENNELNQKVTLLSKELNVLRALFTNGGFTVPCNLQIVAQNPISSGNKTVASNNSSKPISPIALTRMTPTANSGKNHTSVIRTATNAAQCHGVIIVSEPGQVNLDIQAGIQFKDESN